MRNNMVYIVTTLTLGLIGTGLLCADKSLPINPINTSKTIRPKPKKHTLEDERLQYLRRINTEDVDLFLRRCNNPKLSHAQIVQSLDDPKPVVITQKAYKKLIEATSMHMTYHLVAIENIYCYLQDGYHARSRAITMYYSPLIWWVSKKILGEPLPKECCEIIASHINNREIFKAEALFMLRHVMCEYRHFADSWDDDYKQHYQFPESLNALW